MAFQPFRIRYPGQHTGHVHGPNHANAEGRVPVSMQPRTSRHPCRMERTIRLASHQGTIMRPSSPNPSPLDNGLLRFLRQVRGLESGFHPGLQSREIAVILDIPEAFVDALFTSARTRGLLKPNPLGRGRLRWTVSATGERFLEAGTGAGTPSKA